MLLISGCWADRNQKMSSDNKNENSNNFSTEAVVTNSVTSTKIPGKFGL